MKSFAALAITAIVSATSALAASSSSRKCFTQPFPRLLETEIENYRTCGLNNPFVVNFVCVPVRGLVPDAAWLRFQMEQFEQEDEEQVEVANIESEVQVPYVQEEEIMLVDTPNFRFDFEEEEQEAEEEKLEFEQDSSLFLAPYQDIFSKSNIHNNNNIIAFPIRSAPIASTSATPKPKRSTYSVRLAHSRGMAVSAFAAAAKAGQA